MKKDQDHIKSYSAADFARYHAGEMSEQEMHALELAALNDPFLSEALEGYAFTPSAEDDLASLRQQIQGNQENEKKGIVVSAGFKYWMSAAAALLLVAVAAYFVMKSENEEGIQAGTSLAKNESVRSTDDAASVSSAPVKTDGLHGLADTAYQTPIANGNIGASSYQTSPIPGVQKPVTRTYDDMATLQQPPTEIKEEVATDKMKDYDAQEKAVPMEVDSKVGNVITGTVTNEEGEPVPYATVSNANNQVLSDERGKFKLPVQDSMAYASVKATGYDPTMMYNVSPRQDNNIVLKKDSKILSETVVTSTGISRTKKTKENLAASSKITAKQLQSGLVNTAEPVNGWPSYEQYILNSKQVVYREKAIVENGNVYLSFKVNSDGKATKIKVEKSLCTSCDQEAIRLLKEGPLWKPSGGKRVKALIRL